MRNRLVTTIIYLTTITFLSQLLRCPRKSQEVPKLVLRPSRKNGKTDHGPGPGLEPPDAPQAVHGNVPGRPSPESRGLEVQDPLEGQDRGVPGPREGLEVRDILEGQDHVTGSTEIGLVQEIENPDTDEGRNRSRRFEGQVLKTERKPKKGQSLSHR